MDQLPNRPPIDDASITLAYELMLGRKPESEAALSSHRHKKDVRDLYQTLFDSLEFKMRFWKANLKFGSAALARDPTTGRYRSFGSSDKLTIFQTSDHARYVPMLDQTARTIKQFIQTKSGITYDVFVGLKKGYFPHHATFNRIYKLQELIKLGVDDWVLYMDADAYLADVNFDLKGWLSDKSDKAFLFARSSHDTVNYWDINAGIFFANLAHPVCRDIVAAWVNFYDTFYTDDDYKHATQWDSVINDQTSLQGIIANPALKPFIQSDSTIRSIINCREARFARQILRDDASAIDQSLDARVKRIKMEVDRVLNG